MAPVTIPDGITAIGYDLDDTLHYFRQASKAAAAAVFMHVSEEFGIPVASLEAAYRGILEQGQSQHFTENKPSRDYRSARFQALLESHSIIPHGQLEHVLDIYDIALARNLRLVEGAEDVLKLSKQAGYKTFVVSEGPFDAQETTLQRLGIRPYVDVLITSSQEGLSKSGGLFPRALKKIGNAAETVLFVGDSLQRDILPAQEAGIHVLHLTDTPAEGIPSIRSLKDLASALGASAVSVPSWKHPAADPAP